MQLLYTAMGAELKRELKVKKADLMAKLADMPDSQLKARPMPLAYGGVDQSCTIYGRGFLLGSRCCLHWP